MNALEFRFAFYARDFEKSGDMLGMEYIGGWDRADGAADGKRHGRGKNRGSQRSSLGDIVHLLSMIQIIFRSMSFVT
jgi:hypothetical protein